VVEDEGLDDQGYDAPVHEGSANVDIVPFLEADLVDHEEGAVGLEALEGLAEDLGIVALGDHD